MAQATYLFASVRVDLAHGPDGQASPRDGTSPRRDERCNLGAIVALCWVAETPDEAASTARISPSLMPCALLCCRHLDAGEELLAPTMICIAHRKRMQCSSGCIPEWSLPFGWNVCTALAKTVAVTVTR